MQGKKHRHTGRGMASIFNDAEGMKLWFLINDFPNYTTLVKVEGIFVFWNKNPSIIATQIQPA